MEALITDNNRECAHQHMRAHEIAGRITAVYHFTTVSFQTPLLGPNDDGVLTGLWADLANTTDAERGEAGADTMHSPNLPHPVN